MRSALVQNRTASRAYILAGGGSALWPEGNALEPTRRSQCTESIIIRGFSRNVDCSLCSVWRPSSLAGFFVWFALGDEAVADPWLGLNVQLAALAEFLA